MSEQEQAFVSVRVKPGHPTGEYRRSDHVFYMAEPVTMPVEDVTPEMAADPWLIIKPTNAPGTVEEPADVEAIEDPRIGELEEALGIALLDADGNPRSKEDIFADVKEKVEPSAVQGEWLCTVADCERGVPGNGYKTAKGCGDHMLEKHGS